MDFIKLTFDDGDDTPVYVNAVLITIINKLENKTRIEFMYDSYIYVKETPEEIIKLINEL